MTVSVSKSGPFYTTGPISFSTLRMNFKELNSGSIKASELKRNDSLTNSNPIVPTATENLNISTTSNLKLSQFRNSIKYYNLIQTDIDLNLNLDSSDWNGNLNTNIEKVVYINGTCGSNDTSIPAVKLSDNACNLQIAVSGGVYGAGGSGGTSTSISGKSGGDAIMLNSTNGKNISVLINSTGKIYGGGGGGEKGMTGSNGSPGYCINYSYYNRRQCRSCPNCNAGDLRLYCYNRQGRCGTFYQYRDIQCRHDNYYYLSGGAGGEGGNGGTGRGYNNQFNSLLGSVGNSGTGGGCSGYNANGSPIPTAGIQGETGGNGGDWGQSGNSTMNVSSGGSPGRAIAGSNYLIDDLSVLSTSTVKGLYSPT